MLPLLLNASRKVLQARLSTVFLASTNQLHLPPTTEDSLLLICALLNVGDMAYAFAYRYICLKKCLLTNLFKLLFLE